MVPRNSHGWLLALLALLSGCGRPAELTSAEAQASTDALYTAITSKKPELLDAADTRLQKLSADGKLTQEALAELQVIIADARGGKWQAAAEELDAFIRGQPAEGHGHSHSN